jgi:hypothetical protein
MLGAGKRRRDHLFGVPEAVDGGGVDPAETKVESALNGCDGLVIFLISPGELPVPTTDSPCTKTDAGEFEVRVPE